MARNPFQALSTKELTDLIQAAYGRSADNRNFADALRTGEAGRHGITAAGIRSRLAAQGRLNAKRDDLLTILESESRSG